MTGPVFVDVDVLICARDPGEPVKQGRAAEWLAYLWLENLGRTSMQVLSEYYVAVTGKLAAPVTPEDAWQEVSTFFAWRPQAVDALLLERTRDIERRWRLNWWDAMVVAAAQMQDCPLLLTEDLPDGAVYDGVTVHSAFALGVREPAAGYIHAPTARSRHRPRGRPRKHPEVSNG